MSSSIFSSSSPTSSNSNVFRVRTSKSPFIGVPRTCISNHSRPIKTKSLQVRKVAGIGDFSAAGDPTTAGLTWQIVIGAIAGATPFVVAGVEFSKRIMAQKKCEVCGGSGLILKKELYVRCPGCGGFLPWQSWKRFFMG